MSHSSDEAKKWASDPEMVQRARTTLVVSLSKRPPGELVRIIMEWLEDEELHAFCERNLEGSEMKWIRR